MTVRRPSIHLWLVLAMTAFVFTGFGLTYIGPSITGTRPPDSPIVHLHGAAFFSWMALLVVQSLLVNVRKVAWHRSLGTFGIAIGTLVVVMGVAITIASASLTRLQGAGAQVFYLSVTAPPSFALLFILAIRAAKRPAVHRSLILIATVSVLMPGINRVYQAGLGVAGVPFVATYLTMDAFLAAILWAEWRATRSISRTTLFGAGWVVLVELLLWPVSQADWWRPFVFWLGSLAEYH